MNQAEWRAIQDFVSQQIAQAGQPFIQAKVMKRDDKKKLVWVAELGDQPIPLVAFNTFVRYYIVDENNNYKPRETVETEPVTPLVGQTVLIALHMGSRRLPKCLGVIWSKDYVARG